MEKMACPECHERDSIILAKRSRLGVLYTHRICNKCGNEFEIHSFLKLSPKGI